MSTRVRIYPPRKLTKNYLNYDYIVVYYEINGNTRKRSYFSDLKSANDFYVKCKEKLKSQANALGGQSPMKFWSTGRLNRLPIKWGQHSLHYLIKSSSNLNSYFVNQYLNLGIGVEKVATNIGRYSYVYGSILSNNMSSGGSSLLSVGYSWDAMAKVILISMA